MAAELRTINGKNILDLTDEELARARDLLNQHGMSVVSIASPLLKCVLENAGELDDRFEQDVFAAKHKLADQPRLTARSFQIAHFFKARIIRVFSYWRLREPARATDAIARALSDLAAQAQQELLVIGLENEHACNVATAAETARILDHVAHPSLQIVWDPANAFIAGEIPFPDGYRRLPKDRIAHVHAKDCAIVAGKPEWGPLGTRHVAWKEQITALIQDGYCSCVSLETHWSGPERNKFEASRICGWNLRGLVSE